MKIRITNLEDEDFEAVVNVVNVVECNAPTHQGRTIERYDLSFGESVDIEINGWRRYVNVLEMTARED
jgi:hypothetical protein